MRYQQRARRTNQRFMAMSIVIGLLLIAIVYGFLWWASGHPEQEGGKENADTETGIVP